MHCVVRSAYFRIYDEGMTTTGPKPRFFALIVCAGSGSRAGGDKPKQYQLVASKPMVRHTLQAFQKVSAIDQIWVVIAQGDEDFKLACPDFVAQNEVVIAVGGPTRAASVANGLKALLRHTAGPHDWVLVHDAARCLVTAAHIKALIAACEHDAVGGLLALPLADTLKSSADGRVAATISRNDKSWPKRRKCSAWALCWLHWNRQAVGSQTSPALWKSAV